MLLSLGTQGAGVQQRGALVEQGQPPREGGLRLAHIYDVGHIRDGYQLGQCGLALGQVLHVPHGLVCNKLHRISQALAPAGAPLACRPALHEACNTSVSTARCSWLFLNVRLHGRLSHADMQQRTWVGIREDEVSALPALPSWHLHDGLLRLRIRAAVTLRQDACIQP